MSTKRFLMPSQEVMFKIWLDGAKYDKWGWVIYRCSYGDEQAWTNFRRIMEESMHSRIAESDELTIADRLEWTYIEDRTALEGASPDQVRTRFRAWAADPETVRTEQPRARRIMDPLDECRYNLFIHVDDDVLESATRNAFFNLVRGDWKPRPADKFGGEPPYEPVYGCKAENVGWMKVSMGLMKPGLYFDLLCGPDYWYEGYERPPKIKYR
ncbi:hypothetical protein EKO27_g7495 [Xylaria grammica]|uniref:Uncharacterized protein n=1 Tax=Xylaria grammica TaxID=363999 RepID=A0A439CZL5_9PEZI|nr:hypothetical protein EKO27_g7495 [Xylaria grammica]